MSAKTLISVHISLTVNLHEFYSLHFNECEEFDKINKIK